jgi:DNA (cytosine-5)-methyltransferase 1
MSFTFADLFAGIGGFHAALSPLGGECVFASEWDEYAAATYSSNWLNNSSLQIHGDIREITEKYLSKVPRHDVLTGGFPCQPFSKSGSQRGVSETRGTLFYDILKIIEYRKPKIVLLENVRNLVGPKHHSDYLVMVRLLREAGYAVSEIPTILSPHEIPRKYGGSPQHRQRVFIGGIRVGQKRAADLADLPPLIARNPFKGAESPIWDIKNELEKIKEGEFLSESNLEISNEQKAALDVWEVFLQQYRSHNRSNPPGHPLWTEFWKVRREITIPRDTPDWKRQFIEKNLSLFEANESWILKWMKSSQLEDFIPSHRKFEWQGKDSKSVFECLIQFRPSGIRVKEPTYVPAFVAMAQTPVIGWELRELSENEASRLQGFPSKFHFQSQRRAISLKQVGNAVHPGSAALVFHALIQRAKELKLPWAANLIAIESPASDFAQNHQSIGQIH